ncbi:hypothetical protein V1290_005403 [Bradyrhizobium sp. AZCC 1578]|uniref:hypothetical protein n=1 Tax=Bradyrhizobium sp. AZCC 1578 TaxID=3117027 RepID=UPI002FF0047A
MKSSRASPALAFSITFMFTSGSVAFRFFNMSTWARTAPVTVRSPVTLSTISICV